MTTENGLKIEEEDFVANSSENYISIKIGCLKFLEINGFLYSSLNKSSTTLKFFLTLDRNWMEEDLFKRKLAYSYRKVTQLNLFTTTEIRKRGLLFYSKTIIPRFWRNNKDTSIALCNKMATIRKSTTLYSKKDVMLLPKIFQNYIDTCKSAYVNNPNFYIVHHVSYRKQF